MQGLVIAITLLAGIIDYSPFDYASLAALLLACSFMALVTVAINQVLKHSEQRLLKANG